MNIRQWAFATKTGKELKKFFEYAEQEYLLWHCIYGLDSQHKAVVRWKELREYMNEQEKLFNEYREKYLRKLHDKKYKEYKVKLYREKII